MNGFIKGLYEGVKSCSSNNIKATLQMPKDSHMCKKS